jgi:hypothetical protein
MHDFWLLSAQRFRQLHDVENTSAGSHCHETGHYVSLILISSIRGILSNNKSPQRDFENLNGNNHLEDIGIQGMWRIILKWILKNLVELCGLD